VTSCENVVVDHVPAVGLGGLKTHVYDNSRAGYGKFVLGLVRPVMKEASRYIIQGLGVTGILPTDNRTIQSSRKHVDGAGQPGCRV
jgi:hypothetical protein